MNPRQEVVARHCRRQAGWCAGEGEALYARLLDAIAEDVERGGPCWPVLEPYAAQPGEAALPLRFLAAVHAVVLEGRAPELAAHYPSAGGAAPPETAWPAFLRVVEGMAGELRAATARPCQTNEVGRAAALLPAFLAVARATGRPLALLEPGCSAGLNLRFDHYFYGGWGDRASPVDLEGLYETAPVLRPQRVRVAERAGCDLRPIDATSAEGATILASFTWPAQQARMARLRGALEVARRVPAEVTAGDAVAWLRERLERPRTGRVTVVYHSVFLQYLPERRRAELARVIAHAGSRAAADAPLAWVRMEPGKSTFEVRAALWPGGGDVLIGTCGPHGGGFQSPG